MDDGEVVMRLSYWISLMLLLGSSQISAAQWLGSDALTKMVSGKTAYCQHISRPSSGRTYFAPDGTMHGIRRGEARQGRWYVEGNTLCTDWGRRPVCSRYQSDGEWGHYKYKLDGKKIVHIWQWQNGDTVYSTSITSLE
jgi:hypothetical protein